MTSSSDDSRLLGDYRLGELVLETPLAYRWQAQQISVGRQVLVDELKKEHLNQRERFIADVRAKAAMKHPLVASVYEAVTEDDACYYAHECLPGSALGARLGAGEELKPGELAHLLKRVAEVQLQFEGQNQSASPMGLENVRIDEHGVLRLDNLACDGERSDKESVRDMGYLGRTLKTMVAEGQPGSTRLLTLLSWMRGEDLEKQLTWPQVVELCEHIEKQLSESAGVRPVVQAASVSAAKKPVALMVIVGVLALAVVLLAAIRMRPEKGVRKTGPVALPDPVIIAEAAGLPTFRIAAHEVTIGQYARFLEVLETLSETEQAGVFDHKSQPESKVSHVPDDWQSLWQAARNGGEWKGRQITKDSPVVGVDWWDAVAYAEWNRGRLPKHEEWLAALGMEPDQVARIQAADWGPIDPGTADRSDAGVLNMAGSVSEWLLEPMASPANPLGEKRWVLMGGSYLQEGGHAMSQEWVDARSLRREDLGFRVVYENH